MLNFTAKVLPDKNNAGHRAIIEWRPPMTYHVILYCSKILVPFILRTRFDGLTRCKKKARGKNHGNKRCESCQIHRSPH